MLLVVFYPRQDVYAIALIVKGRYGLVLLQFQICSGSFVRLQFA